MKLTRVILLQGSCNLHLTDDNKYNNVASTAKCNMLQERKNKVTTKNDLSGESNTTCREATTRSTNKNLLIRGEGPVVNENRMTCWTVNFF